MTRIIPILLVFLLFVGLTILSVSVGDAGGAACMGAVAGMQLRNLLDEARAHRVAR